MKSFITLLSALYTLAVALPVHDATSRTVEHDRCIGYVDSNGNCIGVLESALDLPDIDIDLDASIGRPSYFTSSYQVVATPEQVVDMANVATGGLPGARGYYSFGFNSDENVVCYCITLDGFSGEYESPAVTATHLHEASVGVSGPPRIAFPNPEGSGSRRVSKGCIRGPFTTGVVVDGQDTGAAFQVRQVEENPAGFFADVHSSLAVPGAVRGQLS